MANILFLVQAEISHYIYGPDSEWLELVLIPHWEKNEKGHTLRISFPSLFYSLRVIFTPV